ncbi:MAG: hypothetical protein JSW71_07845, partial [Gemmatimonadota bacterium]
IAGSPERAERNEELDTPLLERGTQHGRLHLTPVTGVSLQHTTEQVRRRLHGTRPGLHHLAGLSSQALRVRLAPRSRLRA